MASQEQRTDLVTLADGARIHCEVEGSDGPDVVLLHGRPGLWDYLSPLASLVPRPARIFRYDQRGCGRSSASDDLSMARYIADLDELRQRWGAGPMVLVGHSFGAALALGYAARHPEGAAAVCHLSGVGIGDWRAVHRSEVRRRRQEAGIGERVERLDAVDRTREEEIEWRRLVWATDYADTASGLEAARGMAATPLPINPEANRRVAFEDRDLRAWAAAIVCPITFVHGDLDPRPWRTARALASLIPGASFRLIDGAGHLPWVERPDAVAAALRGIVASAG